ncbi:MAG: DUF4442 domain-containing protein [Plesiomonas shigelloides]|uniref:DUF4442 domain-containing protein n=1 Tax=Plesiomonas shigelloides TaxID=703 RepID=UPI00351D00AA
MPAFLFRAWIFRWALNLWPPFFGAGIRIRRLDRDFRCCEVTLAFRWWNKNINRSQFGGSLFAMTDPIYALMLIGRLGPDYMVWDKAADIDFIRPGWGKLTASFEISEGRYEEILAATANGEKCLPQFTVAIKDAQGEIVARVNRTLYVRRKRKTEEVVAPLDAHRPHFATGDKSHEKNKAG